MISESPRIDQIVTEDGILSSMLSNLTLREAVGTSVLSPRWRNLSNFLPRLHFCAKNLFDHQTVSSIYGPDTPLTEDAIVELMEGKTDHFIRSVDSVLRQHCASRLEEFRIRYFLIKTHSHHIDAWIRFAIQSKTKVLGLHLHKPYRRDFEGELYEFPFHLIESPSSSFLEELNLVSCSLKPPCKFNGLGHLKILTLFFIDLVEEDINRLLSNCPNIQNLTLRGSQRLVNLSVPQPLCHLTHLVVRDCDKLTEVNITAVNLKKLDYWGFPVDFMFRQSSQLKDATILFKPEVCKPNLDYYLNKLSRNLPHIQSLAFHLWGDSKVPDSPKGSNSFSRLSRLDWCWNVSLKMSLLHLATLLDASPFLKEFYLRLWTPGTVEEPPQSLIKLRKMLPKHPHNQLKTIGIYDFFCDKWHIEFAVYLLKNAIELETMTIKKGRRGLDEAHIKNLRHQVPTKVKLVIP